MAALPGGTAAPLDTVFLKDRKGNLTRRLFDRNRVVRVEKCANTVSPGTTDLSNASCDNPDTTLYGYDPTGEVTTIWDPEAVRTGHYTSAARKLAYFHDTLGRVVKVEDPDGGTSFTTYDAVGNVETVTNGRQMVSSFKYDGLDRLWEATRPDGAGGAPVVTTITFDPHTRRPDSIVEREGGVTRYSLAYGYDALGREERVTQSTLGVTLVVDAEWDLLGRIRRLTYPTINTRVVYDYDDAYLTRVCHPQQAEATDCLGTNQEDYVTDAEYDALGRDLRVHGPAGTLERLYHSPTDPSPYRLKNLKFTNAAGARLLDFTYQYDANGNIGRITDAHESGGSPDILNATADFHYDERNRLTDHNLGGTPRYFRYDSLANLIGRDLDSPSGQNQFFDDPTRPHAIQRQERNDGAGTHGENES